MSYDFSMKMVHSIRVCATDEYVEICVWPPGAAVTPSQGLEGLMRPADEVTLVPGPKYYISAVLLHAGLHIDCPCKLQLLSKQQQATQVQLVQQYTKTPIAITSQAHWRQLESVLSKLYQPSHAARPMVMMYN
jgi:hypothetical protein